MSSLTELGRALFNDASLSSDLQTSCATCHDPNRAFTDGRAVSVGSHAHVGTRNAPSLVGIAKANAFFWDGRREHIEDAVLDPFTNPADLDLNSTDELLARLRQQPKMLTLFRAAFSESQISVQHVSKALAAYIASLDIASSQYESFVTRQTPLPPEAEHGRKLFEGLAGCADCHEVESRQFTDGKYHFSTVGNIAARADLAATIQTAAANPSDPQAIGKLALSTLSFSSLGRFNVTHDPADIGAFRIPSLRNVAVTEPYMHDGSIKTLAEAVDHEIYYRSLNDGHPLNLSINERQAIVAFLRTLTDQPYTAHPTNRPVN